MRAMTASFICTVFFSANAYSEIDISSLVKISDKPNVKCVEFYNYQGEMYCSTKALGLSTPTDSQLQNYERQLIPFDNRIWQAVWGQQSETITSVEYVPAGDNIDDWKELVTSQFIPNLQQKVTLSQYANSIIDNLQKTGLNPIINIIEESPQQIIFEFRINAPENMQQDELQKVILGNDGFYVLHYVIKKPDMGDEARAKWLEMIRKSSIKQ